MKLNELIENYGNYEVKEGFLNFLEKPRPKTVWDLQKGDEYWFVSNCGRVECGIWNNDGIDETRRCIGNCYLTEEKAEFAFEHKKVIAEMKRLGGTEDMMSLGDEYTSKFFILYNHKTKILCIGSCYYVDERPNMYFASKAKAQKAIDTIGEDRIKKYLFYVED